MQTEPEQWAVELEAQSFMARHEYGPKAAALTIQRAFEERERKLREAAIAQPSGDEVEAVARKLAPFMEGGREYDQMPATRRELKIWSRNGMALINDATQDDAQEAATAAITALDAHRGKQ